MIETTISENQSTFSLHEREPKAIGIRAIPLFFSTPIPHTLPLKAHRKDAAKAGTRALGLISDMKYPNALTPAIIALCLVFSGPPIHAAERKDGDSINTAAFLRRAHAILRLSHDSPHITLFRLYKAARTQFVGRQLTDDDLARLRPETPPEDTVGDKSFVAWLPCA